MRRYNASLTKCIHVRVTPSHYQVVLDMGVARMALKMISRVSG
jgi:hypothetical protein